MTISTCKPKMWLLSCILLFGCVLTQEEHQENRSTGLVTEPDDPLLLFSTLGGSFVGVGQRSGSIRWRQDNEPAVKVPRDVSQKMVPMFLPDPKDGSLYLYGAELEVLKKLPFTIPQLVASSPCRSSDGILYTGRKIDTWFSIDPTTGDREQLLGFNEAASTCPVETQDAIYVGRTEYNIIMVDSKRKERKWNITFYDYSAVKMAIEENDYDLVHFTTSSTGRVVTLDRRLGAVLWELDLGSPVIAVYSASTDGLVAVPFTGVAEGTLDSILQKFTLKPNDIQLYPTLYVGEHVHGLYALPSLVDSSTATISSASDQLMLEGPRILPQVDNLETSDEENLSFGTVEDDYDENSPQGNLIVLGHYKVPAEYKPQNQPLQITGRSDPVIHPERFGNISNRINIIVQSDDVLNGSVEVKTWRNSVRRIFDLSNWFYHREVSLYVMVLVIFCGLTAFAMWRLWARVRSIEQIAQSSRDNSRTNSNGTRDGDTVEPEPTGEGIVKVGKIAFNIEEVLGKGCEGTFVYKGEFDGRSVAVKRLLPDCFTFADREVALLRESDAHANVVRYFCTEQDRMFRYIALELAEATLQDYVLGKYNRQTISLKSILVQATAGLSHLHTLDIVHRDIKPHNVLLSVPGPRGEVRAMISDFGLCKKLQLGRMSFSRRSGVTGTDGWIAPEMLNGERTTCAVDIFSLGCVFYYVLSNGKHPFGDALRRQANILCDESDLSALHITGSDKELALILIRAMIDADPTRRPPALAVKNYPFFWDSPRILNFFQEVSDRVEKDDPDSVALMALEAGADRVVQTDWRSWIDIEVASDLRKYRSYRGESVRDLLRALRNKKHHYRELTPEAQASLGEIPEKFTDYWLSRFSHLLAHSWCAMQNFRNEAALRGYFHPDYEFTTYEAYSVIVNLPLVRPEQTLYPSNDVDDNKSPNHHWRLRNGIDWSPSRARFRPNKRKPERRRPERSVVWTLPSANVPAPVYSRYE